VFVVAGAVGRNHRAIETGVLVAGAVAHTEAIAQMLKYAFGRERPDFGTSVQGRWWRRQQSFPSGHAMGTWAAATVISKEYHENPWIRYGVYAFPIAISASRMGAQRHFLSDVVAGGSLGYLLGSWLFNRHHNPALGGAAIRTKGISMSPDFRYHPKAGGFAFGVNLSR
jgi:membrane-associated phospholipid phosphatase